MYNNNLSESDNSTSLFSGFYDRKVIENKFRNIVNELRRYKGGTALIVVGQRSSLILQVELIRHLLDLEDIDGIIINLARPFHFLYRALKKRVKSSRIPYYVDVVSSISGIIDKKYQYMLDTKVFQIKGPFNHEKVYDAADAAVNKKAMEKHGEEFFVVVDDIGCINTYMESEDVCELGKNLCNGFKGSFVYKFILITKTGTSDFRKIFNSLKYRATVVAEIK